MKKTTIDSSAAPRNSEASLRTYVYGFGLSLYLTLTAYELTVHKAFSVRAMAAVLAGLALMQFVVQLLFFLHLGKETKPRWKLLVFVGMIVVVLILVLGSLWIMSNLNYHLTPEQINNYMQSQNGL